MKRLSMNKKAIVTGANGQLGSIFLDFLTSKGYFVYAIDIEFDQTETLSNVQQVQLDITDSKEVSKFFISVNDLNLLINNAGIGVFTPFEDRTVEEFRKVIDVNLVGTFLMSQAAIKIMKFIK